MEPPVPLNKSCCGLLKLTTGSYLIVIIYLAFEIFIIYFIWSGNAKISESDFDLSFISNGDYFTILSINLNNY